MNHKISFDDVSSLSTTLLIPLWAKAVEYERPDALLRDSEAVRMMALIDFDFSTFASAKLSQPGCCARAALIDEETQAFIRRHPDAVVVQLGAGLDARFERLGRPSVTAWYDLDLSDVITLRRRLLPESGNHYLEASLFEPGWMEQVAQHGKPVLLLLEGVLMYFEEAEIKPWFRLLAEKLPGAVLVFDMLPVMALHRAKQHDALRQMEKPPEFKWGLENLADMAGWQPGLHVSVRHHLSDRCGQRYPWWVRWIYPTRWGKNKMDLRIVQVILNG